MPPRKRVHTSAVDPAEAATCAETPPIAVVVGSGHAQATPATVVLSKGMRALIDNSEEQLGTYVLSSILFHGTEYVFTSVDDLDDKQRLPFNGAQKAVAAYTAAYGTPSPAAPTAAAAAAAAAAPAKRHKPAAAAAPPLPPKPPGVALAYFIVQNDIVQNEVKQSKIMHQQLLDFSKYMHRFEEEQDSNYHSASMFKKTLTDCLSKAVVIEGTSNMKWTLKSVFSPNLSVARKGRPPAGESAFPLQLKELVNFPALQSQLHNPELAAYQHPLVLAGVLSKLMSSELAEEDDFQCTPPDNMLSMIRFFIQPTQQPQQPQPQQPHVGRGKAKASSKQHHGPSRVPACKPREDDEDSDSEDKQQPVSLAGCRWPPKELSKDRKYHELFGQAIMGMRHLSTTKQALLRKTGVISIKAEQGQLDASDYGMLGQLIPLELRMDQFHAVMRYMDQSHQCQILWVEGEELSPTAPDLETKPVSSNGIVSFSCKKSSSCSKETYNRLYGSKSRAEPPKQSKKKGKKEKKKEKSDSEWSDDSDSDLDSDSDSDSSSSERSYSTLLHQ